jgi:hypothetical protein
MYIQELNYFKSCGGLVYKSIIALSFILAPFAPKYLYMYNYIQSWMDINACVDKKWSLCDESLCTEWLLMKPADRPSMHCGCPTKPTAKLRPSTNLRDTPRLGAMPQSCMDRIQWCWPRSWKAVLDMWWCDEGNRNGGQTKRHKPWRLLLR